MKKIIASVFILLTQVSFGQNYSVEDLWKLYNVKDFKSVLEKATPLLKSESDSIDLNLIVGRTYTDQGNYNKAIPYLELTAKNDKANSWRKAWALAYLGTCYFASQQYEESEKVLHACINLNATKNVTNEAFGKFLLFGFDEFYKNWKIVETVNFRFHFQNMNDVDIKEYIALREIAYKQINGFFKSSLPKKIDYYVWESREDAKKIIRSDLGFSIPNICIAHTHYQQTIGHEMTHVISNYTSVISNKTRFINDGTAVYFDQSHQDRLRQVKDWIVAHTMKIAIKDCWENGKAYDDEILYPLSGLFVQALIDNFGREKFLEFFKNQSYENAKLVFGDKFGEVIQEFENKINS